MKIPTSERFVRAQDWALLLGHATAVTAPTSDTGGHIPDWLVNAFFYATVAALWFAILTLSWLAGLFADRAIIAFNEWCGRRHMRASR